MPPFSLTEYAGVLNCTQGGVSATSSTYMAVSSPKPSSWTRNLMRTVWLAYGVKSNVLYVQVCTLLAWWKIVARMVPLASVT